jgi:hypothetical protein
MAKNSSVKILQNKKPINYLTVKVILKGLLRYYVQTSLKGRDSLNTLYKTLLR